MSYDFDDWTPQDYAFDEVRRRSRVVRAPGGVGLIFTGPTRKRRWSRARRKATIAMERAFFLSFLPEHELL